MGILGIPKVFFKLSLKMKSITDYGDVIHHFEVFFELSLKMKSITEYSDVIHHF